MTQSTHPSRPPWLSTWFVELFAPESQSEPILGDLAEEFSDIASKSGATPACLWYWRQSVKTAFHLAGSAFRIAPWSLVGIVLGGILLRRFSFGLPEWVVVEILHTLRPYSNLHVDAYMWLINYGIPIVHVIVSMLVGCVVAFAAKAREMVATITLSVVLCGLIMAVVVRVATFGLLEVPRVVWSFDDLFAIILGGVIVREIRSALARRLSHT